MNEIENNNNLFGFLKKLKNSENNVSNLLPLAGRMRSAIAAISLEPMKATMDLGSDKVSEFQNKVAEIASSDELLKEVSDELGTPEPNESEDQFVERGKLIFMHHLDKVLQKR